MLHYPAVILPVTNGVNVHCYLTVRERSLICYLFCYIIMHLQSHYRNVITPLATNSDYIVIQECSRWQSDTKSRFVTMTGVEGCVNKLEELRGYLREHMRFYDEYDMYSPIEKCALPGKFRDIRQRIRDMQVYEDDTWILNYPRCGMLSNKTVH